MGLTSASDRLRLVVVLSPIVLIQTAVAQGPGDPPECYVSRRPAPVVPIREADVMWSRRIWRELDLREKINLPLHLPVEPGAGCYSLFDVLRQGLLVEGSITAYHPGALLDDDEFTRAMTVTELTALFQRVDTVWTEDLVTGELVPVAQPITLSAAEITRYRIKEDWIFDKQRSAMEVRIIGMAPMREVRGEDGELRGHAPLFWLYYPECRYLLANWRAPGRWNDAERRTFEEIFRKRLFSSQVIKRSNVHDRTLNTYLTGVDALLEGARIEQDILYLEHDLWHY